MLHENRAHLVAVVTDAQVLAAKLTSQTWTLCTGFRLGSLLVLNDATSEDGAPEWACFRLQPQHCSPGYRGFAIQIESITFGWMTLATALDRIQRLQDGRLCTPMGRYTLKLDHPAGPCAHCA